MIDSIPDKAALIRLLSYDRGKLFWKRRDRSLFKTERDWNAWNSRNAGKEAFTANDGGYKVGSINNIRCKAHQVIWTLFHGRPKYAIDHISGDPSDNRIENLRDVTQKINMRNMAASERNSSGCVGVCYDRTHNRWKARIGSRPTVCLGTFEKKSDAIAARKYAEIVHGYHPNHGRQATGG